MKRGPGPRRKTPLKRGPGPKRTGRLKPRGRRYGRQVEQGDIDHAYREWIREQPCAACAKPPRSQAAHARGKGAGWTDWRIVDGEKRGNLCPLCYRCHARYDGQEGPGRAHFMFDTGCDPVSTAFVLGRRFLEKP